MLQDVFANRKSETIFVYYQTRILLIPLLAHHLKLCLLGVLVQHTDTCVKNLEFELYTQLSVHIFDI
jgi:hypothetical protein